MLRLSIKNKILLSILTLLVVISIVLIYIIIPSAKNITELKGDIGITEQNIEDSYQKTRLLRKSIHELDEIYETIDSYREMTVDKNEQLELITKFESLAEAHNIRQSTNLDFQAGDPKLDNQISDGGYFTFTFHNIGSFENHISYLEAIENLPFYVLIDNINLKNNQKIKNEQPSITLNFSAKVFTH